MEVTRACFSAQLPYILDVIARCDFVAIDFEFTGLSLVGSDRARRYDSPQTRYAAAREAVDAFLPLQFGLAAFRQEGTKWTVNAFNIWMFPQPGPAPFPVENQQHQGPALDPVLAK